MGLKYIAEIVSRPAAIGNARAGASGNPYARMSSLSIPLIDNDGVAFAMIGDSRCQVGKVKVAPSRRV